MSISTREKIIDASIELFSIRGYADTSIRDIAKKVGIKTSTIYYHFESKEAILSLILSDYKSMIRNVGHHQRWQMEKGSLVTGESELTAKKIVSYMFFRFKVPDVEKYRRMVKIICSEAVRNYTVAEYFQNQANTNFKYVKSVLDTLIEAGKLPKCDTVKIAAIMHTISFAFMHLDSIEVQSISDDTEGTDMFSLLEFMAQMAIDSSR